MSDNSKIQKLLNEYGSNREKLKSTITELESLKSTILDMFPRKMDLRNKYVIEEKIKTSVEFHNTIFRYLQELNRMTKDEIEIRRKLDSNESEEEGTWKLFRQLEKIKNQEQDQ